MAAEVILSLLDLDGTEGLAVGEEFDVTFSARDARTDDNRLVFSFYTDVAFDPALLSAKSISYSDAYPFSRNGTIDNDNGVIDEVGATSTSLTASPNETLPPIFTVRFEVLQAGATTIGTDAGESSLSEITVIGLDGDQRANTTFTSLSLSVAGEDLPTVAIAASDADASEPDNDATFTISRTGSTDEALEVSFEISGTAVSGNDYTEIPTTATIAAGDSSVDVSVSVLDDDEIESDETVAITLSDGDDYDLGDTASASITITSEDIAALPVVTIAATTEAADESGTDGLFTISRTGETTEALDVTFTVGGTATAGDDYEAITTTVTILAEQSSVTVPVSVTDDDLVEAAETVVVTLSDGDDYDLGETVEATVTITSEDVLPIVTIAANNSEISESDGSTAFTISRTGSTTEALEVSFSISGSAEADTDYTSIATTTVLIAAGESSADILLSAVDDDVVESNETVTLTLVDSETYDIGGTSAATVTILSEDVAPGVVSIVATDGAEPSTDGSFTISRTGDTTTALEVDFTVTGTATAGDDYTSIPSTATIPVGESSVTVPVSVTDDDLIEAAETVVVTLSDGDDYDLGGTSAATVTITSEDVLPVITVAANDSEINESDGNTAFTISRTGSTTEALEVSFSISGSAEADTDYTNIATTTVSIAAGESSAGILLSAIDDDVVESDETVTLTLVDSETYDLGGTSAATVTILSEDVTPAVVSIVATDGAEPSTDGSFTISRTGNTTTALAVDFTVTGTATAGDDYTSIPSTATIPVGESSVTVSVDIADDNLFETDETVIVTLDSGNNYSLGDTSQATITITSDEAKPVVSIVATDATANEPNDDGEFTISRTGDTSEELAVSLLVAGSASAGTDYEAIASTLTIAAGESSALVPVSVIDDDLFESIETVDIALESSDDYELGTATAFVSISSEDTSVEVPTTAINPTSNNLLSISSSIATQIKVALAQSNTQEISEIVVITADDEQGAIDGRAPGDEDYLQAALERATTVFSVLKGSGSGFSLDRILDVTDGDFLQFALITGGSLDDLRNGGDGTVTFATGSANEDGQSVLNSTVLSATALQLDFRLPSDDDFDAISLNIELGDANRPEGAATQNSGSEIIDLTGFTAPTVTVSVDIFREAAFDNVIGFYKIENQQGGVRDTLTGNIINPNGDGYAAAAIANRIDFSFEAENGRTITRTAELETGGLLSTFIVIDADINDFINSSAADAPPVYFSYLGANSDNKDHIRLLGDNTFGYEDLVNGGDNDFNDVVAKFSFV